MSDAGTQKSQIKIMNRRKFVALIGLAAALPLPPTEVVRCCKATLCGREYHVDFDTWIRLEGNNWITASCSPDSARRFSPTLLADTGSYDHYTMVGNENGRTLRVHYVTKSAMEAAADLFCEEPQ